MEMFFAQLLGLYFIIVGVLVLARQKSVMPTIKELAANKPLLFMFSLIELAAGLALVLAYPTPSLSVPGIISAIGWMMVVEGVIYLGAPTKTIQKFIKWFNTPSWYRAGGILSIILGLYLAGLGFGIM